MKLLFLTDLHMTGFTCAPGGIHPRIPEHAWWAQSRRYDLMGYLVPMALEQGLADFTPDLVLCGGDLVDDGFAEYGREELVQVREMAHGCAAPQPMHWLYGNHDGPQEQFAELFGGLNWTVDVAGVRVVGLNSGSMEPEEEVESSRVALAHLQEALATHEGGPVIVALHQWIFPADVHGYSFARAEEALALIEDDPRVVAVLSGHYHSGRYEERNGVHYCTARSLAEPPMCFSTFEVGEGMLTWTEYALNTGERRFVASEQRELPLRHGS